MEALNLNELRNGEKLQRVPFLIIVGHIPTQPLLDLPSIQLQRNPWRLGSILISFYLFGGYTDHSVHIDSVSINHFGCRLSMRTGMINKMILVRIQPPLILSICWHKSEKDMPLLTRALKIMNNFKPSKSVSKHSLVLKSAIPRVQNISPPKTWEIYVMSWQPMNFGRSIEGQYVISTSIFIVCITLQIQSITNLNRSRQLIKLWHVNWL